MVLQPDYARFDGDGVTGLEVSFENRLGPGFQYELAIPFVLQSPGSTGIGDLEIELKQVLGFSLAKMQIFSAGLGVTLPTGDYDDGLGGGTTVFEPFVAFGKAWGRTILQTRLTGEIPVDSDRGDSELVFQLALSQALGPARIAWTLAVEFLGSRNLITGENEWASVIEVSRPHSALGHVIGALGERLPITESDEKLPDRGVPPLGLRRRSVLKGLVKKGRRPLNQRRPRVRGVLRTRLEARGSRCARATERRP